MDFVKPRMDARRSVPALRTGFSMLELLVSISVLGVLVMLLLPSLHSVMRSTAPLMQCTNNLHQIHQALTLYLHDANDFFPMAGYDPMRDRSNPDLNDTLAPYGAGKMRLWICPADPRPTIVRRSWGSEVYPVARLQRSQKVRIRSFDLGASYPLIADRGAFHLQTETRRLASPMNESSLNDEPRYAGSVNQLGFKEGHNALLAQGKITHRAMSQGEEEKPPQRRSRWRRWLGL